MSNIIKRPSIVDLYNMKLDALAKINLIKETDSQLNDLLEDYSGHPPFRIDYRFDNSSDNNASRYIDRICWRYLVKYLELEKYMLCTEYEKLSKEVENFKTPEFTPEIIEAWLSGMKNLIHENIKTMFKSVYDNLLNDFYYTGSGFNGRAKKKRNNKGIDKKFIITTYDYSSIFGYHHNTPTITDDLEKVCYLLDGKKLPEITMKQKMRSEQISTGKNLYFEIKVYSNGNTHFTIEDSTRDKLNKMCTDGGTIGEDIKIKIFDRL